MENKLPKFKLCKAKIAIGARHREVTEQDIRRGLIVAGYSETGAVTVVGYLRGFRLDTDTHKFEYVVTDIEDGFTMWLTDIAFPETISLPEVIFKSEHGEVWHATVLGYNGKSFYIKASTSRGTDTAYMNVDADKSQLFTLELLMKEGTDEQA